MLSRRSFLAAAAGVAAARALSACSDDSDDGGDGASSTTAAPTTTDPVPTLAGPPFTLGVASGDPLHDRVVLWTRLAPTPTAGGGMPDADVPVRWELARDEGLREVVRAGVATATTAHAHSVHVDVDGLEPVTSYWYRFTVGDHESPIGRTRTLPDAGDSPERLRFAFASCQNRQDGYWTAYPHLAEEDLDLVLFLGDYIYESGPNPAKLRPHPPQAETLAGYRDRYGLYKGDPGLQAAHAAFPWLVIWDDHEVDNDYAGDVPEEPNEAFLQRRAEAYQAWWEHHAVRLDPPGGSDLRIHRSIEIGDLARIFLLDGRQYRSDHPCPADIGPACEAVDDPARTMLGEEQESWLFEGLDGSDARWNVLAQPVVLSKVAIPLGDTTFFNLDQWDGYVPARTRILDHLGQGRVANPIVLSGDIHASGVGELMADFDDPGSDVVGAEFVGTSISSLFEPELIDIFEAALAANPHVKYGEASSRGYVRCEVTPESWRADFRFVDAIDTETSPIRTASSWVVQDGRPGVGPG